MAKSINAQAQVGFIAEVTAGVTPATPAFSLARITGESLEVQRSFAYSNELNGKRGEKNYAVTMKAGAGGFDFEWTANSLDEILEGLLRNTWATNVLTDGNTTKPFTFETKFEAGATDVYKRVTGAQINTMSLNLRAAAVATGQVSFIGMNGDFSNAAIAGATYTAGNTEPILVGANVANIAATGGITLDAVAGLTLQINNNCRQLAALGSIGPVDVAAGKLEITGTITAFLDSTNYTLLTAGSNGSTTALSFNLGTTAGKITTFELPNIVIERPEANAPNADGETMVNLNFRALQATSISNSVIRVTRNV